MRRIKTWLRAAALFIVATSVMGFFLLSGLALSSMDGAIQTQVAALDIFNIIEVTTANGWHTNYSEHTCVIKEDGSFYHRVDIDAVWYDDNGVAYPATIIDKVNVDEAQWGSEFQVNWSAVATWSTGETYPMSGTLSRPFECYPPAATGTLEPTMTASMTMTLVPSASPTETISPTSSSTPTAELTPTAGITPVLGTPVAETATPTSVITPIITPTITETPVTPITPTATITPTTPIITETPSPETTPIPTPTEEVTPVTPEATKVVTDTTSLPETGVDELGVKPEGEAIGLVVIRDVEGKVIRIEEVFQASYTKNLETGKFNVQVLESGFVYDRGHLEIHLLTANGFMSLHTGYTVEITLFGSTKTYNLASTIRVPKEQRDSFNFAPNNTGVPDIVTCYWLQGENSPAGNEIYYLKEVK